VRCWSVCLSVNLKEKVAVLAVVMLNVEAGAFAVILFDPLADPLCAQAIGHDHAALAHALGRGGSIHCGFSS
jgi:hypothetical protein